MAGEDDEIEIQVDDPATVQVTVEDNNPAPTNQKVETQPQPRKRTARTAEPLPTGPSPEEALAASKAYAEQQEAARKAAEATAAAERQRADAAEAARIAAQKQSEEHQERANNSELTLIESRIASANNEIASLQDAYTRAAEAGEFKAMGDIQVKLSRASAALDRHEALKAGLETNPRQLTTEGPVTAPQVSETEKFLRGFAPAAQTWIRQHMDCLPPAYGGSAQKNALMMQGHYAALAKNLSEGSSDYFKEIESHVNPQSTPEPQVQQHQSKAAEVQPAAASRPAPAPAAPPSRDAPQASGQSQRTSVRLTKEQQEMAKLSFPKLTEQEAYGQYARNLLELEAEGKIGRTTH